jgi:asparagine synthase (glutamine-hydrolysing)
MCGIGGYIAGSNSFSKEQLKVAVSSIKHRGPDAGGFYFSKDGKVGLGHRRLSILDLSATANQPMFSANGRYCIVFNGEVYNFRALKNQLSDKGAALKTTSDTEVILELFAQEGPSCFAGMNGMFAFAIFDLQKKELTLCRDHSGVKPLFLYQDEQAIIFASELKVIKSLLGEKLSVNRNAVPFFLHLGFIPHPFTIYSKTSKFPAAHYAQISVNGSLSNGNMIEFIPFWKLENAVKKERIKDEVAAKKELENLLTDSVQQQLISDVPVGTFLSGGVDSSLVTAIAVKLSGADKIKTFSIAIDDAGFNESKYARQVANHLKTAHYQFNVKEKDVIGLVDKLLPAYDEPFADASAFPTMMVSRLAKEHVTVALSGDGGDELFHGYGMYKWAKRLSAPHWQFLKHPLFAASKLMNSKYQRIGNMFAYPDKKHLITHIFSQEQYFFREEELLKLLVNDTFNFDEINILPDINDGLSNAEKQSFWDVKNYLKDDLLVKVDRASMQFGLESRVPLLDFRLVEFAFNLDEKLKISNGSTKYLLKQVLFDYLPKEIFHRPKQGFGIPLARWLKTDLKYLLDKYTSKEVIDKYNIVHFNIVDDIRQKYLNGTDYLFNRLWLIIVLHWWLEENSN